MLGMIRYGAEKVRPRGARARARPRASANRAGAAQRGDNCWRTGSRRQSQERAHNATSRRRPFALLALVSVRPPFSTRRQTRRAYWAVPPHSRPAKRDAHRTHLLVKQASSLLNHRRSPRLPSNSVPILGCALSHSPTPLIGVKCRCLLLWRTPMARSTPNIQRPPEWARLCVDKWKRRLGGCFGLKASCRRNCRPS